MCCPPMLFACNVVTRLDDSTAAYLTKHFNSPIHNVANILSLLHTHAMMQMSNSM